MPFKNKQSFLTITIVAVLAGVMIIIGCGEDNGEIINVPPDIDNLNVPEQVNLGDSVEFQVLAHDDDGDLLTYKWEVEAGELKSDIEQTVTWTAPAVESSVTVKVIVDDGVNKSVVKSKTIKVFCIYEGCGESVPEYAGQWKSIRDATGSKNSSRAYLSITIEDNGTFSGTYQSYVYSYSIWITIPPGIRVPVEVYNPNGNPKSICGEICFSKHKGKATFEDLGSTDFDLTIHSNKELALVFPSGFEYTVANIKR